VIRDGDEESTLEEQSVRPESKRKNARNKETRSSAGGSGEAEESKTTNGRCNGEGDEMRTGEITR
jgi:hypothetical protein